MTSLLAQAADVLERDDDVEAALALALEAWRACRTPALAAAIDDLGRALPPRDALPTGKARASAITALIADDDPADFDVLSALPVPRGSTELVSRLKKLARRSADPRFASYLVALVEMPPSNQGVFWREIFELIVAAGDPRAIDRLANAEPRVLETLPASARDLGKRRLRAAVAALREQFSTPPELGEDDAVALAGITTQLAARGADASRAGASGDELLAAIYANPRDVNALAVYADWLQRRDDPRGELIALQLADKEPRRVRELVAAHGRHWLGAIGPIATASSTRFERGLPVAVTINARSERHLQAAIGAPEWATIEELTFSGQLSESKLCGTLVCDPALRSLRVLRGIGALGMEVIAKATMPLAITTLHVGGSYVTSRIVPASTSLPRLEHVVVGALSVRDVLAVASSALAARLQTISSSLETTAAVKLRATGGGWVLTVDLANWKHPAISPAEIHPFAALPIVEVIVRSDLHEPLSPVFVENWLGPLRMRPHSFVPR